MLSRTIDVGLRATRLGLRPRLLLETGLRGPRHSATVLCLREQVELTSRIKQVRCPRISEAEVFTNRQVRRDGNDVRARPLSCQSAGSRVLQNNDLGRGGPCT